MTTRDELHALWGELVQTTKGYRQLSQPLPAGHWANAKAIYDRLDAALAPPPPPPPPPINGFGGLLPPRLPEAAGPVVVVSTLAELQAALVSVAAGTRIQARGGVYGAGDTSEFAFATKGTRAQPVQLEPYPGDLQPTLSKLFHVVSPGFRLRGFKIAKNSYPTDARFGNPAVPGGGNMGVWIDASDVEVDRCDILGSTMSGLFGMGDRVQVWNTRIHGCGTSHDDHGIYWANGGSGGLVANCIIDGNAMFGLQAQYAYVGGPIFTSSTIVRNGLSFAGSGTVQAVDAHDLLWVNVVSAWNGEVGFKSYVATRNHVRRSLAYGNPQGATYGPFASVDLLPAADPLLDPVSFKPLAGSPCIGAADPAYTPTTDFYGKPRVTADLGAVSA